MRQLPLSVRFPMSQFDASTLYILWHGFCSSGRDMRNRLLNSFKLKALVIFSSVLPLFAFAETDCGGLLNMDPISLTAAIHAGLPDVTATPVVLTRSDLGRLVSNFTPNLRPEFEVLIFRSQKEESIVALVPKRQLQNSPGFENLVIDQQVVQWQTLPVEPDHILGLHPQKAEGALSLMVRARGFWGGETEKRLKTSLIVTNKVNVEKISFADLVHYLRENPHVANSENQSIVPEALRTLFGKVWIKIFARGGGLNSFITSKALLEDHRLIVPGKKKLLHISGQIFTAELNIDSSSPFSGKLAPGRYWILGRLSSSMKNLNIQNQKGEIEPNSLAMGLLIFRTPNQAEQPGLLFLQDSLLPVQNPGLTRFQLTNNPGFAFKPVSVREFFEQGATVAGVGLSSFLSARDSGRGVQGNYRSNNGAAANSVNLGQGGMVLTPRFLALQFTGPLDPRAETYSDSLQADPKAEFTLRFSNDGRNWSPLGVLGQIQWMGIDSHELSFPHGKAGTIDPESLRASSSTLGIRGLELPVESAPQRVLD
jgi:hypothetical protein